MAGVGYTRVPTLRYELEDIHLFRLDGYDVGRRKDFRLPKLTYHLNDTMEVDLQEASLYARYDPETRTLSIWPNLEIQGSSEVIVKLTSGFGVTATHTFKIMVAFLN